MASNVDAIVVVAMDEEAAPFLAAGDVVNEKIAGNALLRWLRYRDRTILLVRSGISYANSVSGLVAALYEAPQTRVVFSAGTAGGLAAGVGLGDVVVGETYIHCQVDATAFGYAPGQVPQMPASYRGDGELVAAATSQDYRIHRGLILAGDSFASPAFAAQLLKQWPDALCVDMESTALAQVAYNFGLRFVSVRAISDLCAPDEFDEHVDDAAQRSASVVLDLIQNR
ncbi:5'-methylthioadenosine/S-adenosylhomocysteine nucleosidase [Rarobacter incanus]|uniref:adenosylhomocysteine nucleosidase n=1 Tax=Rarobacter incanus TaxID=153494 RepID=A0A542SPF9_9MICO|nr:5'-methylthioadenosine/S-adenosylhomocysteine nucleosidase [Rarobacter incanus]TQK76137.1 adenosylhomocysteine nucleosidase [Rarobacter incanus]